MTQEEFVYGLDGICDYMKKILVEKNKSYGSASFDGTPEFAITGNYHRQFDKICRYKNLISKMIEGNAPEAVGESLWDTLCDIWGYATIGLLIWNQKEKKIATKDEDNISSIEQQYYMSQALEAARLKKEAKEKE